MEREFISLGIAVLAIADDATLEQPIVETIVARVRAEGHEIVSRGLVPDNEAAIRKQLGRWIADPNIDVVIAAGEIESVAASTALAPLVTRPMPGFCELIRVIVYQEIGTAALQSNAEAAECGATIVFLLPASMLAVTTGLDKLVLPQLDHRTEPRNLVMTLRSEPGPAVVTIPVPKSPRLPAIPKPPGAVPVAIAAERTAAGVGLTSRLPAVLPGVVRIPEALAVAPEAETAAAAEPEAKPAAAAAPKPKPPTTPDVKPKPVTVEVTDAMTESVTNAEPSGSGEFLEPDSSESGELVPPPLPLPPPPPPPSRATPPPRTIAPPVISRPTTADELPRGRFVYPPKRRRGGVRKLGMILGALIVVAAGFFVTVKLVEPSQQPGAARPADRILAVTPIAPDAALEPPPLALDAADVNLNEITMETDPGSDAPQHPRPPPRLPPAAGHPDHPDAQLVTGKPPVDAAEPTATAGSAEPTDPACDEVSCALDHYRQPCCERFKPADTGFKPEPAGPPDHLERAMVAAGVERMKPVVIACGEKTPAKGIVKVALVVNGEGVVQSATIEETPDPALGACVAAAMRKATFGKTVNGGSFTYPFAF